MHGEATARSREPLTLAHLRRLSAIAEADREMFYRAQPAYRGRHLATVLAQGAALHWVDRTTGVKDLDVWSFFAQPPGVTSFPANQRKRHVDFGPSELGRQAYDLDDPRLSSHDRRRYAGWSRFTRRRVDLMMRGLPCAPDIEPAAAIRDWLSRGTHPRSGSPWHLAQKAVVLIDPPERRGEVVWPITRT
jgi:hypothetical protein